MLSIYSKSESRTKYLGSKFEVKVKGQVHWERNPKIVFTHIFVVSKSIYIYRVGQINWHHFTFLLVGPNIWMHPQNFIFFGTYILHNAENEMMLSLCHYINSFSPEGATNTSTFCLQYSSFTSLNCLHWNSAFFLHSLLKFYTEQKIVWFAIW